MVTALEPIWPALPYREWRETCATLHLWTQIVGKIRLAQTPWLNHSWHVPLYVSTRGLTSSPIPCGSTNFELEFNFRSHQLTIERDDGGLRVIPLEPKSVAEFYGEVMQALAELGSTIRIDTRPCEIAEAVPFNEDRAHSTYDPEYANRFWRVLVQVDRVLRQFRTGFLGKASPVHFFWGSFDLAVTRFSGRQAPRFSGSAPGLRKEVMQEAYSHEVSSAGFWPGGAGAEDAAFYSYAYPEPEEFSKQSVSPEGAGYDVALREFVLPYETVRAAPDPEAALLAFLRTTYAAAARSAHWDSALGCNEGAPGHCRALP